MLPIENIIQACLTELSKIANEEDKDNSNQQSSKLIFPQYLNGKHQKQKRVSEQEVRLLFIRELEIFESIESKFYYSIETPTRERYKFSDKNYVKSDNNNKKFKPEIGKGQSASFDLTIYNDKFERVNFIEFKNDNVDTVEKDFLKLLCDVKNLENEFSHQDKRNYLIHIINRRTCSERTIDSIKSKYQNAIDYVNDKEFTINSRLKIVLFFLKDNEQIWFEEININSSKILKKWY